MTHKSIRYDKNTARSKICSSYKQRFPLFYKQNNKAVHSSYTTCTKYRIVQYTVDKLSSPHFELLQHLNPNLAATAETSNG